MPARKSLSSKKSSGKTLSAAASIRGGALPPYGVPIREAISRGDAQEMRAVASTTRMHLKNVQSALAKLEAVIARKK
jgi:hypothetical protein